MKQKSALDKTKEGKPIIDSDFVAWIRGKLFPLLKVLTASIIKFKTEVLNTYNALPDKPIIFVGNHQALFDTPIAFHVSDKRSYIIAGKQNLTFVDQIFFNLVGAIWIDRKSKDDMVASKDAIIGNLKKGRSVIWFPEGTWNLTANQLIMPLKWGIIDVARQSDAQIIPIVLDYNRRTMVCRVKFGKPVYGQALEDKANAIKNLRDELASIRWELMCLNPTLSRTENAPEELQEEMYKAIDEYPPLDWEYEKSCIYQPYDIVETFPKNIRPNANNAFLFNHRLKG